MQDQGEEKSQDRMMKTKQYFQLLLKMNGEQLKPFEAIHIMVMYFVTDGLKLTNQLDQEHQLKIRQYVLSLEIASGGWTCSSYYSGYQTDNKYNIPHIVFTYSAINILSMVGGLDKINKQACLKSIAKCQQPNGAYSSFWNSEEADLRFVYSAITVCHTLNDFSRMDIDKVLEYIENCYNFDGGYGLRPSCQSHSGAIYCALASIKMLKKTLNFLINRQAFNLQTKQIVGVQGRVGKHPDSCYSFWVGASIKILTGQNLLNPKVESYINLCYRENECSFSKYPSSAKGDPVHSAHSIVGLRLCRNQLQGLNLEKGIVE